jgi:uncharacterized Zn-binding protein involved in type VI secretion
MPPASRLTDIHACPLIPAGPVSGPCVPTVLTGKLPQAVFGDLCACVGPPDAIVKGSRNVLIGKRLAARMGDNTAKGGAMVMGFPTVLIGERTPTVVLDWSGAGAPCLKAAAAAGSPFVRA